MRAACHVGCAGHPPVLSSALHSGDARAHVTVCTRPEGHSPHHITRANLLMHAQASPEGQALLVAFSAVEPLPPDRRVTLFAPSNDSIIEFEENTPTAPGEEADLPAALARVCTPTPQRRSHRLMRAHHPYACISCTWPERMEFSGLQSAWPREPAPASLTVECTLDAAGSLSGRPEKLYPYTQLPTCLHNSQARPTPLPRRALLIRSDAAVLPFRYPLSPWKCSAGPHKHQRGRAGPPQPRHC